MKIFSAFLGLFITFSAMSSQNVKFDLRNSSDLITGQKIEFSEAPKKYRIFFFVNSTCPCTQAHFDHMNELKRDYPEYSFFGFHSNKAMPAEVARNFFSKFKIDFPVIEDRDLKYANLFSANKTPHVFVLDGEGKVAYQGGVTNSRHPKNSSKFYLKEVLSALSTGKELPYTETRTLGCYIAR